MAKIIKSSDKKLLLGGITKIKLNLPMEFEEPSGVFEDFDFLIHGPKKVGKTSLALRTVGGGRVFLIEFDPSQKAYRRMERCPKSWKEFIGYLELLEYAAKKPAFPYERVVIDGADAWFRMCQKWACEKLAIDHPSEEGWGKGWDLLRTTFKDAVNRMMNLPCGCWFICHSSWKEVELASGEKGECLVPNLTGQAEEILNGLVEGWFAYDYIKGQRALIVSGSERIGAGHRLDEDESNPHFRTTKGGKVHEVSMGASSAEGYANLVRAYQNEQNYSRLSELNQKGGVSAKKILLKRK